MKVALLVCLLAATAHADPAERDAQRKQAEALERAAKETKDWDKYVAAAKAFLDIYNADPQAPDNDQVLYNAGITFEQGRSIGDALLAFSLLEKYYPNSKVTQRAVARVAWLYGTIGWYDKAAAKLEQYAKRYAGEKDAYNAMLDAIYFRKGLGDRAKTIEDTKYFIKTFGAKKPREAADAMWSLTSVYEPDRDDTIKHLRDYLRLYAAKGPADRIVIAHAKLGAVLWKQSCPHATVDGLCVKVKAGTPRTCGTGTTSTMTATRRDEAKQKEAFLALAQAVKEYERKAGAFDDPAAGYYYAQAKLAEADLELESFLTVTFPRSLSFDRTNREAHEKSLKRFESWLEEKQRLGGAAMRKYDLVLATKDAASSITAASRIATITQSMASSLVASELPRDLRGPRAAEKRQVYCEKMTETAAPLESRAVESFAVCLAKSTELGWFEASSRQCERQLAELAPDKFPLPRERYIEPMLAAPVLALEPPLR